MTEEWEEVIGQGVTVGEGEHAYHDEAGLELYSAITSVDGTRTLKRRTPDGTLEKYRRGRRVLYRLPQVIEARAEGNVLYLVESEQTADELADLFLPATCPPGGLAKLTHAQAKLLAGAQVVILGLAGEPDRTYCQRAARYCRQHARSVRVVDLPGLEPREDVLHWLERGHDLTDLLRVALVETPVWQPGGDPPPPPASEPDSPGPSKIRGPLHSWSVVDGQLVRWKGKGTHSSPHRMFNGVPSVARVATQFTEDRDHLGEWIEDEEFTYRFRILGRKKVRVIDKRCPPGREGFLKLLQKFDLAGATDALRSDDRALLHHWAMTQSPAVARTSEVKAIGPHGRKGWIAPPAIRVRGGKIERIEAATVGPPIKGEEFRRFRLSILNDAEFRAAARWIVSDLLTCDHADGRYTLPLLGAFLNAPLWSYVEPLEDWQRFTVFVQGESAIGKSQLARYFWSFWGDFTAGQGLTTWRSSATYIEALLHGAVGVPVLVCDWKRSNMSLEAYRSAMGLLQAYADRSARGRALRGTAQPDAKKPPRCAWITDGEHLPEGEQSTLGRLLILRVSPVGPTGRCATTSTLDAAMVRLLPGVTARWIAWVQREAKTLAGELHEIEDELLGEVKHRPGSPARSRIVRSYAIQELTIRSFALFLKQEAGVDMGELVGQARTIHVAMAEEQLSEVQGESAGDQFLSALVALLRSGTCHVAPRTANSGPNPWPNCLGSAVRIGTYHYDSVSIWPDVSVPAVNRHLTQGGGGRINHTRTAIRQQLEHVEGFKAERKRSGDTRKRVWTFDLEALGIEVEQPLFHDED